MSFILDALKKSERERQRTAVPGISDLPVVVESRQSFPWAGVALAAMLAGAAAFAWVWWQSPPDSTATTIAASVTSDPAAMTPAEPVAAPPRATTSPPATRSLSGEATRAATTQRAMPAASDSSLTAPTPTSLASTRPRGTVTDAPMSILEARASGMPVPELALELLVFSDDPRQRFVYINAAKYVEGDTLAAGPRLVEISTEGAVLTFNGRTFLLPQN